MEGDGRAGAARGDVSVPSNNQYRQYRCHDRTQAGPDQLATIM